MRTIMAVWRGPKGPRVACVAGAWALGLSGCTTPLDYGPQAPEIPLGSKVQERASDIANEVGVTPGAYVAAGYVLTYDKCTTYFNNLIELQNQTNFTSDVFAATGTMTSAMVSLRKNATDAAKSLARIAAGASFVSTLFSNYEDRLLMTPYPSETKSLILAGLNTFEKDAPPSGVTTSYEAAMLVQKYAELCTYSGITRAAKQAIANARPENAESDSKSILSQEDRINALSVSFALDLNGAALTDRQIAVLYYYLSVAPADTYKDVATTELILKQLPAKVIELFAPGDVPVAPTMPKAVAAKGFLDTIAKGNPALRALAKTVGEEVAAAKKAQEETQAAADAKSGTKSIAPAKTTIRVPEGQPTEPSRRAMPFIRY